MDKYTVDKFTIIDKFHNKLDDKNIIELNKMLNKFQRKIELETSKVISNEISKVIDQVQDEATLSREKPNDEFLLDKKSDQMQIVIDIPEAPLYRDMYTAICENGYIYDEDNEYIAQAIKNGTILPKGHETKEYEDTIVALEQGSILDKIRAEIEVLEYLNIEDGSNGYDKYIEQYEVLKIIDKYKEESEE